MLWTWEIRRWSLYIMICPFPPKCIHIYMCILKQKMKFVFSWTVYFDILSSKTFKSCFGCQDNQVPITLAAIQWENEFTSFPTFEILIKYANNFHFFVDLVKYCVDGKTSSCSVNVSFFSSFPLLLIWPLQGFLSILEINRQIQMFVSIAIHGYYNLHNKNWKKMLEISPVWK